MPFKHQGILYKFLVVLQPQKLDEADKQRLLAAGAEQSWRKALCLRR
jgi:hypothetical protein